MLHSHVIMLKTNNVKSTFSDIQTLQRVKLGLCGQMIMINLVIIYIYKL